MVRASVVDAIPESVTAGLTAGVSKVSAFKDLRLVDSLFSPGVCVDLLLGTSHCNMCPLPGVVFSQDKKYKAKLTIFEWAFRGSTTGCPSGDATSTCLKIAPTHDNMGEFLQRFWALEEVTGDRNILTAEEQLAVSDFRETHSRSADGQYVVGLPKEEPICSTEKVQSYGPPKVQLQ